MAKEGGGEPWTVSARSDRCPGLSPSGHVASRDHMEALPTPVGPWPPGSCPNSPYQVLGWGPQGLGKAAPCPPHSLTPNPLTYHSSSLGRQPLPTRPGGSTHTSPQ